MAKTTKVTKTVLSAIDRAQYLLDNYQKKTLREMAIQFGWLSGTEKDPKKKKRALSRVEGLKRTLEKKFQLSLRKPVDSMIGVTAADLRIPKSAKA